MRYSVRLRSRFPRFAVGLVTTAALLTACGDAAGETPVTSSPPSSPEVATATERPATVAVQGFLFQPDVIEVPAGTTVTWENADKILHTATAGEPGSPSGLFDGQMDGAGTSFSHTFDAPGTVSFFCTRHLHMRGEVIVR